MITLFSIPKAFTGHFKIIQTNALKSWVNLGPWVEVIIFGDDRGVTKTVASFSAKQVRKVKRNKFGTPLLSDAFEKVKKIASHDILAYVNGDVILMKDFLKAVGRIKEKKFLLVGRRWNFDQRKELSFSPGWEEVLRRKVRMKGKLFEKPGVDYFVFPKGILWKMPPFAVGRASWDNWIIYQAKKLKIPVIDATETIMAVHQGHDYSHAGGEEAVWHGPEREENRRLAGGPRRLFSIKDVDWRLTKDGLKKPPLTLRRIWRTAETLPVLYPKLGFLFNPIVKIGKIGAFLVKKIVIKDS